MESIIALRRINQKHWQARLSCSNCLPHCSAKHLVPCDPELELTFSSYDSDNQLNKKTSRHDFPLEFLPSSAPKPEEKLDKQTEVKPEYKQLERQEKSDCDLLVKADGKTSKSEKRSLKADKYPNPIDRYPSPLQEKKGASKACAEKKGVSKAGSKAAPKVESRASVRREDICCSTSRSTKSVQSDFGRDFSAPDTDPCFPPRYQEKVQDIAMGKEDKKKVKSPKPPKTTKETKLERKSSARTKNTKLKPKDKDKKKKPHHEKIKRFEPRKLKNRPTLTQIGGSVRHNCCSCLDAMALYMKEFLRFSCSLAAGRVAQDTQFQERVCDMLAVLRAAGRDCCHLARYVLRLLFVE